MDIPTWVGQALDLSLILTYWQQLGLAFLLGTFAVATWSDLKHSSAQREFLRDALLETAWQVIAVKWGLILVASLEIVAGGRSLDGLPRPHVAFAMRHAGLDAGAGK